MTPQAKRAPAFPVDLLNSCPPSPKSSWSAWTTTVRPKMLSFPLSEICLSVMSIFATPASSAMTFPKSPACRTPWVGPPCSFPNGLKWGPADMHPLVLSPNSWTWNPWRPALSPVTSPVTFTASDSDWKCKYLTILCKSLIGEWSGIDYYQAWRMKSQDRRSDRNFENLLTAWLKKIVPLTSPARTQTAFGILIVFYVVRNVLDWVNWICQFLFSDGTNNNRDRKQSRGLRKKRFL